MRSGKGPLLALMPSTEQLGSLRKAHRNPFSEPRVEHGSYVSLVPESDISDTAVCRGRRVQVATPAVQMIQA